MRAFLPLMTVLMASSCQFLNVVKPKFFTSNPSSCVFLSSVNRNMKVKVLLPCKTTSVLHHSPPPPQLLFPTHHQTSSPKGTATTCLGTHCLIYIYVCKLGGKKRMQLISIPCCEALTCSKLDSLINDIILWDFLAECWCLWLWCGPGSSTAISSTAVSSTLIPFHLSLSFLILCKNTKTIHLLDYPITKSC